MLEIKEHRSIHSIKNTNQIEEAIEAMVEDTGERLPASAIESFKAALGVLLPQIIGQDEHGINYEVQDWLTPHTPQKQKAIPTLGFLTLHVSAADKNNLSVGTDNYHFLLGQSRKIVHVLREKNTVNERVFDQRFEKIITKINLIPSSYYLDRREAKPINFPFVNETGSLIQGVGINALLNSLFRENRADLLGNK